MGNSNNEFVSNSVNDKRIMMCMVRYVFLPLQTRRNAIIENETNKRHRQG